MDPRVERIAEYIDAHLRLSLTVAMLADQAELSVSQLTRLFRADLNTTPAAYLHRRRMTRARLLVERTSLPISEVMAQVGISDPSHFATDFRREYGLSPRALRQQLRASGGLRTCLFTGLR